MLAARKITPRTLPTRSNAPPRSQGPPPLPPGPKPLPSSPFTEEQRAFPPAWATSVTKFSTLSGALSLSLRELKALAAVPHERSSDSESSPSARITRTQTKIMLGQRIDFAFQSASTHIRNKGLPIYTLAMASEGELIKHIARGSETVMESFKLRRICVRVQWPFPREGGLGYIMHEEWVTVNASTTKVQIAMATAGVFRNFYEKFRIPLGSLSESEWVMGQDAFYRVWLTGLERTGNNVFTADLRYVKDYPTPEQQ
ncbi:hypothetical protein C8Q78DRAFT_978314 [Trametes maxima]|nr:hypothetical protein C8Q78DRAFT_978314 [Trametes maxima]